VRALSSGNVDAVLAPVSQARESCEPWQGIQDFLRTAFVMQAADRGLSQILRGGELGATLAHEARIRITPGGQPTRHPGPERRAAPRRRRTR